jgi:cobalt/nickel transport system ATP-binding protein
VFGEFPEKLIHRIPHYLSGGEKKLVAIAGILAMEPKAIVADEITANLDPFHSQLIERVLIKMKEELNISIVFATHNLDMALRLADRVCIINQGAIIMEGTPEEILMKDDILKLDLEIPHVLNTYKFLLNRFPNMKNSSIPRTVDQLNSFIQDHIINNDNGSDE